MSLSNALDLIESFETFHSKQRGRWIEARKLVELWPERQEYPALEAAYQAVADMPEALEDEGGRWEELRHQMFVVVGG